MSELHRAKFQQKAMSAGRSLQFHVQTAVVLHGQGIEGDCCMTNTGECQPHNAQAVP